MAAKAVKNKYYGVVEKKVHFFGYRTFCHQLHSLNLIMFHSLQFEKEVEYQNMSLRNWPVKDLAAIASRFNM